MNKRGFSVILSVLLAAAGATAAQQDELALSKKYKMVNPTS